MRYQIVDGFRGFFLVFMCVVHVNAITDVVLGKLNHHAFGWVEDAQGFIFISGVVVGLVYGKVLAEKGFEAMRRKLFGRIGTIYRHQLGLIALLFAGALTLGAFGIYPALLAPYNEAGFPFAIASSLLVAASRHMDILPLYMFFMLATPLVLVAFQRGYAIVIGLVSLLLWFFLGQSGALDLLTRTAEMVVSAAGSNMDLGIFFNVFGWQVLFFSGLYFGTLLEGGRLSFGFMYEKKYYYIFLICLFSFVILGVMDRVVYADRMVPEFSEYFLGITSRQDFTLVYLISFFVDLFLVVWLLTAGRSCGIPLFEFCGAWIQWLFTRRPLVLLGQHSLHVFSFHVLLVYVVAIILEGRTVSEIEGGAVIILSVLSLYLPAYAHRWMRARARAARLEEKGITYT